MKYFLKGIASIGEGMMSIFGNLFGSHYTPEIKTFEDDWFSIRGDWEKIIGDWNEKK